MTEVSIKKELLEETDIIEKRMDFSSMQNVQSKGLAVAKNSDTVEEVKSGDLEIGEGSPSASVLQVLGLQPKGQSFQDVLDLTTPVLPRDETSFPVFTPVGNENFQSASGNGSAENEMEIGNELDCVSSQPSDEDNGDPSGQLGSRGWCCLS